MISKEFQYIYILVYIRKKREDDECYAYLPQCHSRTYHMYVMHGSGACCKCCPGCRYNVLIIF